jgi:hypothetical protein
MTAQVHERLIIDGGLTSMAFCPPLPHDHPRIVNDTSDHDTRASQSDRGSAISSTASSTACWRRYIGTWEIKDGRFYLIDLVGLFKLSGGEPLFADWFTGVLRIPVGNQLQYVHMGFGTVYESELHIRIERGREVERRSIDNRHRDDDEAELSLRNLPGRENRFPGDDYWK